MTDPTPLSPAAQAVWIAYLEQSERDETPADLPALSAALRAAADQVIERLDPVECLYAIADELEGAS